MSDTPASSDPAAPEQGSRVVRVFISSTFRDFGAERDLLMKRVFPELRRRARDRFVEILGIDLRWGITEEQSEQGETLPVCLREIERSRPYFLGFLGQRYGWTPAAGLYPELLLAQQPWLTQHAGGASVTELEILHGVLNAPEMAGRAFFYFRDPSYAQGKGADFASEGDAERSRLALLKDRIRSSPFPVTEYATPEEAAYRITEELWRLIDAEYPADDVPDELERTRRSHEAYAAPRRRMYIGQEKAVAALLVRLEAASDEPDEEGSRTRTTLVTAESGTGKSALIANTLSRYREVHPDHVVIEHYTASSGEAADHLQLVRRLSEHIKRLVGSGREIESDAQKLIEQLPEWLAEASFWARERGMRVILAVDALDRLGDHRWLPRSIPPHVYLVASALPGAGVDAMLKRGAGEVVALPFAPAVARQFVVQTLQKHGRQLPGRELDRILAHPRATLPIWLKTLVDELSVHGSHEGLSDRITECLRASEPDDLFEVILARLEADLEPGSVQKPLEAIWASADGMSEDELVRFTGVSPLELAQLRLALDDALFEAGGRLHLGHAFVRKGVGDRYLPTDDEQQTMHRQLGLWWEQQDPSPRMANELDLQLVRAEAWDDLLRCLTTPRTGVAMIRWVDHTTLWQCWYGLSRQREHSRTETLIEDQLGAAWPAWRDHADATLSDDERALTFGSLSDFLMEYGGQCHALPLAAAAALDALDSENCEHFRADARQAIAFAIARLGDARRLHGDTSGAATLYQRALEQLRRLAPCPASDQDRLSVSFVIERMACIEESSFNSLGAIRLHYEALELRRSLHCDDDPWTRRRLIAGSEHNIGNLALSSGNIEDARTRFHESIGTLRQIPPELMRPADHLALAKTLGCLADSYIKSREYDEAKRLLYEALAACGRYGMCTATVEFESVCAVLFTRLGDVACTENDLQFADGCFQRSLFLSRRTYEGPHNSSRALGQCWAIHKLAELDVKRGDLAAARTRSREAIELCRSTALRMSTPDVDRCLATLLVGSAYLELHFGDTATAHELLQEALPHRRRLEESDRSSDARGDLATLLLLIADIEYWLGEPDSALAKYQESLELARKLYARSTAERDPEACNGVVWSAHLTGTCLIAMHRPVEALELLHTHAADAAKLEAECGDDLGHLNTCAAFWETFSAACSATGDSTAAATYAARAEGLRARIGAPQKPAGDSPA